MNYRKLGYATLGARCRRSRPKNYSATACSLCVLIVISKSTPRRDGIISLVRPPEYRWRKPPNNSGGWLQNNFRTKTIALHQAGCYAICPNVPVVSLRSTAITAFSCSRRPISAQFPNSLVPGFAHLWFARTATSDQGLLRGLL